MDIRERRGRGQMRGNGKESERLMLQQQGSSGANTRGLVNRRRPGLLKMSRGAIRSQRRSLSSWLGSPPTSNNHKPNNHLLQGVATILQHWSNHRILTRTRVIPPKTTWPQVFLISPQQPQIQLECCTPIQGGGVIYFRRPSERESAWWPPHPPPGT